MVRMLTRGYRIQPDSDLRGCLSIENVIRDCEYTLGEKN